MRFEFKLRGAGWATAELGDDTNHITIDASYLSDCLGDLLHGLWRLIQGETETRCSWEEEPGEYRWIMRRDGDDLSLRILEFPDSVPPQPDEAGRLVFETRLNLRLFARAIALGASRTLAEHGESGYRSLWVQHPFPTRTLELIQNELRA